MQYQSQDTGQAEKEEAGEEVGVCVSPDSPDSDVISHRLRLK